MNTPLALCSEALKAVIMSADYLIFTTPVAPMDLKTLIEIVHTMGVSLKTAHRVVLTEVDFRSLKETSVNKTLLFNPLTIPTGYTFIRQYKAHEQAVLEGVSITELRENPAK